MYKFITLGLLLSIGFFHITSYSFAQTNWGNTLKSAANAVAAKLSPQAQSVVDQSKKITVANEKESFLIGKAKAFLSSGNYQSALDVANYLLTTINSGSIDAKKIVTDAKTALTKIAQDKITQAQKAHPTAAQAASQMQNIFTTK